MTVGVAAGCASILVSLVSCLGTFVVGGIVLRRSGLMIMLLTWGWFRLVGLAKLCVVMMRSCVSIRKGVIR